MTKEERALMFAMASCIGVMIDMNERILKTLRRSQEDVPLFAVANEAFDQLEKAVDGMPDE